MAGPTQGQVYDGYRYLGGDPKSQASWEQAAPVAAPEYGNGAQKLPNGDVVRYGPRGGMTVLQQGGSDGVGKLTEDQGKSGGYARLQADAEASYQKALDEGFNPTGIVAGLANFTDNIPGAGGIGNFIRNDAGDRARQAELQWTDAQLKAMSGAASPEQEVARNNITFFARPGQNFDYIGDRLQQARGTAFQSVKLRAGPAGAGVEYPTEGQSVGPTDPATGLPTYPGLAATVASANGGQGPTDPQAPPPVDPNAPGGPQNPIDLGSLGPEDLLKLQAGQYVRRADGTTYALPSAPFSAPAQAGDQREGNAVIRPQDPMQGYDTALQQERAMSDRLTPLGGGTGMASQVTAPFNDELAYAAGYLTQGAGNIGRRLTGQDVEVSAAARGRAASEVTQQDQARYAREHPIRNGMAMGAGAMALGSAGTSTLGTRMLAGAGVGSAFGVANGDTAQERGRNALIGGGVGAVAAPVAERILAPVAGRVIQGGVNALQSGGRFLGRQIGNAADSVGAPWGAQLAERAQPNALAAGAARFAQRSPQDVNALNANVTRLRAEGIDPTFADAIDDGGRGVLRATNTRQTPARQATREFADGRRTGLQDRVSTQARRHISEDPRSPLAMTGEMTSRRAQQADAAFGAVRGEPIQPERAVIEALRAPALKPAIEEATTAALNRGDSETANALQQLAEGALDNPNGVQITVGMADRLSRSLNGRAEAFQRAGNNDAAAAHFALAERLRGTARQQVPGYDAALKQFADESGKIDAVALGEGFMSMEADQFAAAVAKLSPEERAVARASARRAVERQAGTQGQAPGVAQRLSGGREQTMRSAALLDDPSNLQRAMSAEREVVRNAQAINPSAGSQTSMNAQDAMNAAGVIGGVRDVATGNVGGVLRRIADGIKSRGFNDQEAEAIGQAAIDPAQTDRLISMLAQRMTRREARTLARTLRYQATTVAGQSRGRD